MKRQSRLSLVMVLTLFVSMLCLPFQVQGQQPPNRFRSDTGVITLGIGQKLVVYIGGSRDAVRVRFAWMRYMPAGCYNDGVCRHVIQSEGATAPVNLGPNQAASFEVQGTGGGVRIEVRVATGDVTGDECIINSATGEVTSHVIMANTEG